MRTLNCGPCPFCGNEHTLEVKEYEYNRWKEGKSVQAAFQSLDNSQRELIITGIDQACWEKLESEDG